MNISHSMEVSLLNRQFLSEDKNLSSEDKDWISEALEQVRMQKKNHWLNPSLYSHIKQLNSFEPEKLVKLVKILQETLVYANTPPEICHLISERAAKQIIKKGINQFQSTLSIPSKKDAWLTVEVGLMLIKKGLDPLRLIRVFNIPCEAQTACGKNVFVAFAKEANRDDFLNFSAEKLKALGLNPGTPLGQQVLIEIAKLAAMREGGKASESIQCFGIDSSTSLGQKALIDIAKMIAGNNNNPGQTSVISKYIKNYDIGKFPEGQKALIDIAKMAAQTDGETSEFIQNYGINPFTAEGQKDLIEIAKLAAKHHGWGASKYIQNYGIDTSTTDGQNALVEIAKLAAINHRALSLFIQNYGIEKFPEGKKTLIEIAKLAAQNHGSVTSMYIQKYGIDKSTREGQKTLIEIAKIAAQQYSSGPSEFIQHYGIDNSTYEGQKALIEIAKLVAQHNRWGISKYILNYGIAKFPEGQKALIEIAKLAAQNEDWEISEYIQNYGIDNSTAEGQKALAEIAMLAVQENVEKTSEYIQNYGIDKSTQEGQKALIEISKLGAKSHWDFSSFIQKFGIDPSTPQGQQGLIEIAKISARRHGGNTSIFIQNYGIDASTSEGQDALIEIAKLAILHDGYATSENIKNYGIKASTQQGQKGLIEIAKLAARETPNALSAYIQNYDIDKFTSEGQKTLIELAKLAAQQKHAAFSGHIHKFGIDKSTSEGRKALIEIAKLAAKQDGSNTSEYIQNYSIDTTRLDGQRALIEIAMLGVQQCQKYKTGDAYRNGYWTSRYIQNYGIDTTTAEGQKALIEIAKLAAQKCGWEISVFIENYGIHTFPEGKKALFEIAKIAAQHRAPKDYRHIQNFGIDPSTQEGQKTYAELLNFIFNSLVMQLDSLTVGQVIKSFEFFKHPKFLRDCIPTYTMHLGLDMLYMGRKLKDEDIPRVALEVIKCCEKQFDIPANDLNWVLEVLKKNEEPFLQKNFLEWFISLSALCAMRKDLGELFKNQQNTVLKIAMQNPQLRDLLAKEFINLSHNKNTEGWQRLKKASDERVPIELAALVFAQFPPEGENLYIKALMTLRSEETFRDEKVQKLLLETLIKINNSTLESLHKRYLINELFKMPIDIRLSSFRLVGDLLDFKMFIPFRDFNLKELQSFLVDFFGVEKEVENFSEKYETTIGTWRNKEALSYFVFRIGQMSNSEKAQVRPLFKKLLIAILEQKYQSARYDTEKNPHLAEICLKHSVVFSNWSSKVELTQLEMDRVLQENSINGKCPKPYQVIDSDDPNHILSMYRDIKIWGFEKDSQKTNECLLSCLLDGKHRVNLVLNKEGQILAFAVSRLLMDANNQPVLFLDRMEGKKSFPLYNKLLSQIARKKAAVLGIPMVVNKNGYENTQPYPYAVHAKEKPIPFELLSELNGIQSGPYTLKGLYT